MIDLSQHGMTHEEVLSLLQSDWGLASTRYRIDVLMDGVVVGELPYTACTLEFDATADVKHYGRITTGPLEWDLRKVTLQPVQFFERGELFEFPFPPLMPVTWDRQIDSAETWVVEAYDETVRIQENSIGRVIYYPEGYVYTAAVEQLLREAGFHRINIEPSGQTMREAREDWAEGDYILPIVNQLLEEIGYQTLSVDREGIVYAKKYAAPTEERAKIQYVSGQKSVIGFNPSHKTRLFPF